MHLNIKRWGFAASALCWTLSGSMTLAQVKPTPIPSIRYTFPGSGVSTIIDILEWDGDVPSKVAIRDTANPAVYVQELDHAFFPESRFVPARGAQDGWSRGQVSVPGPDGVSRMVDATYRGVSNGVSGSFEDPAIPGSLVVFDMILPGAGEETVSPAWIGWVVTAIAACWTNQDRKKRDCRQQMEDRCGVGEVQCSGYSGVCGVGGECTGGCWNNPYACD